MKRINYSLILTSLALTMFLFSCSMKKIDDIKDKFDEPEQVENGIISDDSLAHASEAEEITPAVKSTTETGEITAESSAPKKVFTGKVFYIVEQMPSFPGGLAELMKWLDSHVRYPTAAIRDGIQGRVFVSFIVEPDGSISNVKLVRSVDVNLDREALRVVSEMPNWTPGKQGGNKVRVRYSLPIAFRL